MKKINHIVIKMLLLSMFLFLSHDYITTQNDIVSDSNKTLLVEHHVFHTPVLSISDDEAFYINLASLKPEFYLEKLSPKDYNYPLFSPPRAG